MKDLLSKEAIADLEYRINQEEFSSRLYEDMSLWFEDKGYAGFAALYSKYAQEELTHAGWSKKFLLSFDLKPCLKAIPSPEAEYNSCMDILEATVDHEKLISEQCQAFAINALKRGEIMLHQLGLKYCSEQVEELDKAFTIRSMAKLTSDMLGLDNYIKENYL